MAIPSNILLPPNAKYFGFIDPKLRYNSNWDINWSFEYSLVGTEHGFCTFLTTTPVLTSGYPGQYLGYIGDLSYLLAEDGTFVLTESSERILLDGLSGNNVSSGVLAIAFDSTGLFALSSTNYSGVGLTQIHKNALIIRDNYDQVIFNAPISALDTSFVLGSTVKVPQTLRFRYANGNKITIDYKTATSEYKLLTSVQSRFEVGLFENLYVGFSYCSPISSASIQPSTLYLKNFHTQGNTSEPTVEESSFAPLTSSRNNSFTTLSGVSAYKVWR